MVFGAGIRQRLGCVPKPKGKSRVASKAKPVNTVLRTLYKKGKLQATYIHNVTSGIEQSYGSQDPIVSRLSRAGAKGKAKKNVARDVISCLAQDSTKPEVYTTKIVFWDDRQGKQIEDDVDFLIPYETIEAKIERGADVSDFCSLPSR